jgi:hypothetical protein
MFKDAVYLTGVLNSGLLVTPNPEPTQMLAHILEILAVNYL